MGYTIAAYIVVISGLGFYWWTLMSRLRELRSEAQKAGVGMERGRS
ncbi:MAG: hypothetical protein O2807_05785 [bacterium]|nr:hypothetical protein [bacterium]